MFWIGNLTILLTRMNIKRCVWHVTQIELSQKYLYDMKHEMDQNESLANQPNDTRMVVGVNSCSLLIDNDAHIIVIYVVVLCY